jgi:biotin carboxyl carrier protein
MNYEVVIDGSPARLSIESGRLRYAREASKASDELEREYSITAAGAVVWSVLMNGRSFSASLLANGEVSVNGRVYRVEVFDPRSMRGRRSAAGGEGRQTIAAPMPGRVIRVLVEVGQEVAAGEGLIVVEAMKMQNEMKSPKAGRVVELKTTAGATVAAGDVLAVVE